MAFPDAVDLVIGYLDPIVAPVKVANRVPNPRPDRFVQVRRVGGPAQVPVRDRPRLDVFAWAPTDPQAMALALQVRTALWALAGTNLLGVAVYRVSEFMGPRQDDDTLPATTTTTTGGGTPRVWATYELDLRADDVIHAAP
jgi:hypothetical protein